MVGPAPDSSFEMDELADQPLPTLFDTLLMKDTQNSNELREVLLTLITIPFVWGASDEDSPLTTGLQYTTEASEVGRILGEILISLKNAPTDAAGMEVDVLKETAVNSNVFATILTTKLTIDQNEFTSQTAAIPAVLISSIQWEKERRLQIVITENDLNFAATGLKVSLR